jgi:FixJ family two-component response regulator
MISLVDDDDEVRQTTASLLRSLGYKVQVFASGRALLDYDRLNDTACLITDVMMPEIDGHELQRLLAINGCRFPIIFLTAVMDMSARARLLNGGAHCVLIKPCSQQSLINYIESAIHHGGHAEPGAHRPS